MTRSPSSPTALVSDSSQAHFRTSHARSHRCFWHPAACLDGPDTGACAHPEHCPPTEPPGAASRVSMLSCLTLEGAAPKKHFTPLSHHPSLPPWIMGWATSFKHEPPAARSLSFPFLSFLQAVSPFCSVWRERLFRVSHVFCFHSLSFRALLSSCVASHRLLFSHRAFAPFSALLLFRGNPFRSPTYRYRLPP